MHVYSLFQELRGNKLGSILLQHAIKEAHKKGFENLYLCTDLEGYYEKYSWSYVKEDYVFNGEPTKLYRNFNKLNINDYVEPYFSVIFER